MVWGSTYITNLNPLVVLQKKTIRILCFAKFKAHTNPLFARLKILKLHDIIFFHTACFMYKFSKSNLPKTFDSFSLVLTRDIAIILVYLQNPPLLYQIFEPIMGNLILRFLDQKFGIKLKNRSKL